MKKLLLLITKLTITSFLLFTANFLKAEIYHIDQLPFAMSGDWQICVQQDTSTQMKCKNHKVPSNVETAFPDYDGFILYRSQFTISKELSEQALGIYLKSVRDSDEFYLNGQKIGKTGEFKPNFKKATLFSRYYFIPSHLLRADKPNIFEIKVFNHVRYGGIIDQAPVIDLAQETAYGMMKKNSSIMLYIGIFFIIFVTQVFYFFAQRHHKEHLYFALFSIGTALYLYSYSNFPAASNTNINAVFSLNIFLFAVLTILFCLFITKFFHHKPNLLVKATLVILVVSGVIQITVLPLDYVYYQVLLIDVLSIFILIPYYVWLFYSSIQQKIPYARTMALVSFLYIMSAFVDILTDLQILPPVFTGIAGLISPIALMVLFVTVSLILTHRHWLYYRHATYDYLTDALRRSAFIERLSEEIPRSQRLKQPLMIALLDIDNFKEINDQHTHIAGDKVLVEVVQRIREQLREFDLISRYGGDEFCIAASVADTTDAMNLLKRVKQSITAEKVRISKDKSVEVTMTIGAYVADPDSDFHPEALIGEADKILIQGKVNQKGKIHI